MTSLLACASSTRQTAGPSKCANERTRVGQMKDHFAERRRGLTLAAKLRLESRSLMTGGMGTQGSRVS